MNATLTISHRDYPITRVKTQPLAMSRFLRTTLDIHTREVGKPDRIGTHRLSSGKRVVIFCTGRMCAAISFSK